MFKLVRKYTKDALIPALLGPLFVIGEVIFDVFIPYVMSLIIDEGITARQGDISYITKMGALMVGLSILAAICGVMSGWLSSVASGKFARNIRAAMYRKLQTFDFKNIEKFQVPTVVTRFTRDMRMMRMSYVSIVKILIRAPINLCCSLIMVYRIHNKMALIFAVILPVLATGLYLIFKNAHPRFKKMMYVYDDLNGDLEENIESIRLVKTFVREDYETEKFGNVSKKVTKIQRNAESIVILNDPFFNLTMYTCMILIAWIGGNHVIDQTITTGQFMSYLSYVRMILFSLMGISDGLMNIVMSEAAIDRCNEILDEVPDIDDSLSDENLEVENGDIEFKNVSFKYSEKAEKNALSNINLKINTGEVIGILGATGSSKSTLVQLIPRLYDVNEGEILVAGHNVKEYKLKTLRNAVSMVLQKNTLFSGTIEDNMKWGNPNATHEEIVEACKKAQAHEFIMNSPDGYMKELGQGGVNVSGGQKQRLCIARALLKKPKIIILDDSTSAVDTETDHKIQLALKEQLSEMTTIIIAQRVSSVKEANRIIIMEDGKIVDIGNHEELLKRNEVYHDLYYTQMEGMAD